MQSVNATIRRVREELFSVETAELLNIGGSPPSVSLYYIYFQAFNVRCLGYTISV